MPRVNLGSKPKYEKLMALIYGVAKAQGKRSPELAKMAKLGGSTIYARFKRPGNFTLDELSGIRRGLGIPIEEFQQCIRY